MEHVGFQLVPVIDFQLFHGAGKVALDGKKRFSSFVPGNGKQYKEAISNYIKTILPVWMQYRNMYINI